ncbi:peptidase inhibitor family I36 protein [Nocardia huaxiensis]|uniref:Peptidase inhibitor family I36 protein n=1 Tax=Nocardia huaxiensis TaxID=2755382 RepID=A0A7D6VCF1_9NOCA|nr:peptidase inhibitor family I36 protein [Nocardia huaxiensis]QLY31002.1 peptidase inhibitor family I36 protein [Nocardia huaxiensis]UFS94523.1 peptidase inhibitor family I36 protein [Nocardia huaxiensis]
MSLRSRLAGLAGIGLLAFASTLAGSTPAQAATGYERCPTGWICLFDRPDGEGTMKKFAIGSANLAEWGAEDFTRSLYNRTGAEVSLFTDRNYKGISYAIQPNDQLDDTPDFDISSLTVHNDHAVGYNQCPDTWVCLFDGPNATGNMYKFKIGSLDLRQWNADNKAVSMRNRSGKEVNLYEDYNYASWAYTYAGHDAVYNGYQLPSGTSSIKVG